jgi:hypothetical protein
VVGTVRAPIREPSEPREPAPAPAPGAGTLTYDPGSSAPGESPQDLAQRVLTNPIGFVVGGLRELFGSDSGGTSWQGTKIVADGDTGKVTAKPTRQQNVAFNRSPGLRQAELDQVTLLQRTFDTGLVQSGIAPYYATFAEELAAFRIELDQPSSPGRHVPTPTVPGDRGETVPGFEAPRPPDFGGGIPFGGGGAVGDVTSLNIPVDLRNLFMTPTPFMPFSGLPSPRGNGSGGVRRRSRRKKKAAPRRARRARSVKRPARLVAGSAAAKRYMARLRAMRR